jgi:tight adherence protein C
MIWFGLGLFAFIMAAITIAGYYFFLRGSQAANETSASSPATISLTEPSMRPSQAALVDVFRSIGENFPGAKQEKNPYRKQLLRAGFRWASALPVFYGIKCGASVLLACIFAILTLIFRGGDVSAILLPMVCGAALGFLIPDRFLKSRIQARAKRLRTGLPAALDLMVLSVEAGQSLDLAIADTSRGLRVTHPELSSEFVHVYLELRASSSRAEAFRKLTERNQEPELRKLATLLIDSDRFGSPLGPALRMHSKYLRIRFRQQAQESARKVGVKLIFPVFFLIFPSVLLVTLGPACIMMFQQLSTMLR